MIRITIYLILAILAVIVYTQKDIRQDTLTAENYRDKGYIKVNDRYIKYSVYEKGEVKTIADMLAKGCSDDFCEIEHSFNYVMKLPYTESQFDRDPSAVINQHGGDCDEKAYLFISLLIEQNHECILVFTKEHAFVAVHVDDESKIVKPAAYLSIRGQKFYYAETAADGSYLGWFNDIETNQFEAVYDVQKKNEIPLSEVTLVR